MNDPDKNITDWKLKLRYGHLKTEFRHYTVIADGSVLAPNEFNATLGKTFMGMKVWASSTEEAAHMIRVIGRQLSFSATGKIEIFATAPEMPPGENPRAYGINFTPYK